MTSPITTADVCSGGTFNYTPTSNSTGVSFLSERITDPNINGGAHPEFSMEQLMKFE